MGVDLLGVKTMSKMATNEELTSEPLAVLHQFFILRQDGVVLSSATSGPSRRRAGQADRPLVECRHLRRPGERRRR
jgi:hypothetical protein